LKLYEKEIEQLYRDGSKEFLVDIPPIDLTEDITAVENSLGELVANVLGVERLPADQDFFAAGMDSLQVMNITRQLEAALGGRYHAPITYRLIYANSTLATLATTLKYASGTQTNLPPEVILRQYLEKYIPQLPANSVIDSKKAPWRPGGHLNREHWLSWFLSPRCSRLLTKCNKGILPEPTSRCRRSTRQNKCISRPGLRVG
jgi:aryl carrier-like protein